MMIETKSCQKVLLLAGDTMSRVVNQNDSTVAPLFGDAGSSTLIENGGKDSFFSLHSDGKKFDTIIQPKGAFREPSEEIINDKRVFETSETRGLKDLYMDGAGVFNFSIEIEPKAIEELKPFLIARGVPGAEDIPDRITYNPLIKI